VLIENELAYGFLSNPRKITGHFLVIPKRHVESLFELKDSELIACFGLIRKIEKTLLENGAEGCDIRQNFRPFLPQGPIKVDHVHFHILPRGFQDELYHKVDKHETEMFIELPEKELTHFAKLLKNRNN
jgi:diadenosine tetraphosphate (Ap4A) HIT family hydrolase